VTLLAHDWGGWLGLRVVAADPARFARIVVSNTGLPTCDEPMNETARAWFEFAVGQPHDTADHGRGFVPASATTR
jgi:haloalkane dehalogenase